ncbi:hypothetical protein ACOY4E_30055 [Pseudomonas aeruginosa]|uniref:hypothetical protein n=1 Tax=Pseudomonas aeruginosa TaxID=287 RepID=UPI0013CDE05B|nr:hypothetical protein [Pseudomonas aeruginosa]MDI3798263.1 hypothetical protein [Pseudomonas aeruginosa]HCE5838012.1 hypothetical protein [Pseudomonas aeruginosa]HCF5895450.1 hypothetical protein [Pseudomonas aeruginosa]HCR1574897.1 hypothetical protein [Pseudomonas aeruginosa]HDU8750375.1 hypothetical protein [Pseudomonas aeruginosa]
MKRFAKITSALLLLFTITACSAAPSDDVLVWAITQKHPSIDGSLVVMKSYDITNHYTREIRGEIIYVYDYTVTGTSKLFSGEKSESGTFSLVKRGEKWYMYR